MAKTFSLALALLVLSAPLAFAHDPAGTPRNYCEDPSEWSTHDYVAGRMAFLMDGNVAGDCDGDTLPADYDGHMEWGMGGATLLVQSGDGVTSGSVACYGEVGHHPAFGPIRVEDVLFGNAQEFVVAADHVSLVPPTDPAAPQCGDFEDEAFTTCVGSCTVTFPPGVDGAYHVHLCVWVKVNGHWIPICLWGHVSSP